MAYKVHIIVRQVWLGKVRHFVQVPRSPFPKAHEGGVGQQALVVVPVGNDVYSTAEDYHPRNGFVEGQVLVQEALDGARRALVGRGEIRQK